MSWLRKKKKYNKPRNMYDSSRIESEGKLVIEYGLKNKKEIWKAGAEIDKIRARAKQLITASGEKKEELFNRLNKIGLKVGKIADILALEKEDWLERRLQTLVYKKGLAQTPKQARQLIVHGHITIDNKVVNVPSYVVKVDEEGNIDAKIDIGKKQKKKGIMKETEEELREKVKKEKERQDEQEKKDKKGELKEKKGKEKGRSDKVKDSGKEKKEKTKNKEEVDKGKKDGKKE